MPGFPKLGVTGAAIATVLSRYVETAIIMVYTHMKSHHFGFIRGAYRSLRVPKPLMISILRRGTPLLVNEFLWSSGMAVLLPMLFCARTGCGGGLQHRHDGKQSV